MSEKTELHDPFIKYLKNKGLRFTRKNWNNHNRQVDDGFPDFQIFLKYFPVFIEFKTKEKYKIKYFGLSKKQLKWREYFHVKGYAYLITYELDKAIKFVEEIEERIKNEL